MQKRFTASQKTLRPDPRFNSKLVSKFINCMMWDGKKSTARTIFYKAMNEVTSRLGRETDGSEIDIFITALDNVKPAVEIQAKRVGGATYQVPMRVSPERQQALAIRWVIEATRGKKGRPMHMKLADELTAAFRREGEAVTRRENVHRMADANKAFAHFGN